MNVAVMYILIISRDIYADIQKKPGSKSFQPAKSTVSPSDQLYGETPALPPRTDSFTSREHSLHKGIGNAELPQQGQQTATMVDNDLYDRY